MNIFEQYGIKEVADVTIYAIDLDKNDDEIYIPIMYLDTLKVSTIEQTANTTSARGGIGNPNLITWDYGKDITLNLEDALFTPASQSLMWGGKFGIKRPIIQGLWNPRAYKVDEYGTPIYLEKTVVFEKDGDWVDAEGNSYDLSDLTEENGWYDFICPCDQQLKYMKYTPVNADFKYTDITQQTAGYYCPRGFETGEKNNATDTTATLIKSYYWNVGSAAIESFLRNQSTSANYKGRPERAQLLIDDYSDFQLIPYNMQTEKGILNGDIIELSDDPNATTFCIYTPIDDTCEQIIGNGTSACGNTINAYGYIWNNTNIKMVSLEGNQDMYYLSNVDLRYRMPQNSTQKEIMLAQRKLKKTYVPNDISYEAAIENDYNWSYVEDSSYIDRTSLLEIKERRSYGFVIDSYSSKIDFFVKITITIPKSNLHDSRDITLYINLGSFYIIADWNYNETGIYEMMNPINSGIEDVYAIDRMEKCKATQTFAIDTNKNLKMSNYRYLSQYDNTALTVFIDPKTMCPYEPNSSSFTRSNGDIVQGNFRIIKQHEIYYKWTRSIAPDYSSLGSQIIVDAKHFPGAYRIVGETYARSRSDGKDERYQFEIPLAKLSSDANLTLQADGDPTTFSMSFQVLRRDDGVMMKLTKYNVDCEKYDGITSGSTKIIPQDTLYNDTYDQIVHSEEFASLQLVAPQSQTLGQNIHNSTYSTNINPVLNTTKITGNQVIDTRNLAIVNDETKTAYISEPLASDEFEVEITNKEVDSE